MIQPLGNNVLVQAVEVQSQIKGGIHIPDTAAIKPQEQRVIAVGTGGTDADGNEIVFEVSAGDLVITGMYDGTCVKHLGIDYKLVPQTAILAILGVTQ